MPYFDDITFLMAEEIPACRVHVDKRFPDMYSLEYLHGPSMYLAIDHEDATLVDRPLAHWHHPDHHYRYGPASTAGWHHFYVTFRGTRGKRILESGLMPLSPDFSLSVRRPELFASVFRDMVRLVQAREASRHPEAVMTLERLVFLLMEDAREIAASSPYRDLLDRVWATVRQAPYDRHSAETGATTVGVSVSHFRRLFQQHTGQGFHDFVLATRMQQASRDLQDPAVQIKDVSAAAGYLDPAQFSKLFKSRIGVSPSQYRAALMSAR